MDLPRTFAELSSQELRISPASHRLHPISERDFQFVVDETELLACHDLSPYGSRTIESVVARDLLPVTNTAKDYTLFEIPDDLLTLDRVTLGNGFRNISQLIPVYKEAGSLIGRYSREYKMRHLGIKSLAILRNSGQLVFAPAYHFEPGNVDPKLPIGDFSKSVKELLHHVLYGRKIVSLVNSLEVGYHDARNES